MLKDAMKFIESDELHLKQAYRKWRVKKLKCLTTNNQTEYKHMVNDP